LTLARAAARRLAATSLVDARLQWRQGFYAAATLVLLVWAALLAPLPEATTTWLLPIVVLGNVLVNAFYFIGGLVLLEKREATLEAQIVTPLRAGEYLGAKAITLTVLSLVENVGLVLLTRGPVPGVVPLAAGIVVSSLLLCWVGFFVVSRYDSINEFLIPSVGYATLLFLPLISYLADSDSPLFWLHPLQPALALLGAAFRETAPRSIIFSAVAGLAWAGVALALGLRAFRRFVIRREGAGA